MQEWLEQARTDLQYEQHGRPPLSLYSYDVTSCSHHVELFTQHVCLEPVKGAHVGHVEHLSSMAGGAAVRHTMMQQLGVGDGLIVYNMVLPASTSNASGS